MADQNGVLSFTTKVDLSGVQQGMAAATQTIQSGSQTMASAMNAARISASQLSDAYKAFGSAAAGGSAQAKEALNGYIVANEEAQAAVEALAASEASEEVVLKSTISTRMAASAELRIFEGSMTGSTRAAGALLSMLPGVGAAMQAAFPVFGAIALVEILGQVAEKVHKVYDEYVNLRTLQNSVIKNILTDEEEEIRLSNQKLAQLRDQRVIQAELTGPRQGRSDRGAAAGAAFDLTQDQGKLSEAQGMLSATTARINELTKASQTYQTMSNGRLVTVNTLEMREAAALLPQLREDAQKYSDTIDTLNQKVSVDSLRGTLRNKEAGEKEAGNPNEAKIRSLETTLLQEELLNGKSASAEVAYWSQYTSIFAAGTEQYNSIASKLLEAKTKVSEEFGRDAMKLVESGQREIDENNKVSEALIKNYGEISKKETDAEKSQASFDAEVRKLHETMVQSAANIQLATIAQEQSTGSITKLSGAHQIAAIHAQEYADKLKALKTQLDAINAETPDSQKGVEDQERRALAVQQQMEQVKGQKSTSAINDQTTINNQIAQPYVSAFNEINNSWLSVQNKLITGTRNVGAAFANMGVGILESVAGNFEKMIAKAAESEIRMLIIHMTTNQAKVATDATAAAQSDSISALSSLKQVSHEAAVAAAGAWAALSNIPIIGPVLGGVAAAATYAGVMALAAFDVGGIIPNTGVALVHQGEAVLPANLTGLLMNAAGGGTTNSASSSMIQNNHFSGSSDRQFQRQLQRNSKSAMSSVRRQARSMGKV